MLSYSLDILHHYLLQILIILCLFNYALMLLMGYSRISFLSLKTLQEFDRKLVAEPFISIHLAICNEPSDMVLETINAILNNVYTNYEIIIISNNTTNKDSYVEIEKFSKRHKKIKFAHFDSIAGAKAGALNKAIEFTDSNADYVFIVDADYKLNPSALTIATTMIEKRNVDLLQFPQSYRNVSVYTKGLQINYKHYFDCYLNCNRFEYSGLPTGTLSIIKRSVFDERNKWPTETITEDAHLGIEMLNAKYRIGFCNLTIGKGTMPITVVDYSKQFKRWIFGNFQTLVILFSKSGLNLKNKIHLSTMLTAWINLLAIPIIASILSFPALLYSGNSNRFLTTIIILSFLTHVVIQFFIFYRISLNKALDSFRALLIHLATVEIGSFYWLYYIFNKGIPFHRTNKFLNASKVPFNYFILPLLCLLMTIYCFISGFITIGVVGVVIFVVSFASKLYLCYEIKNSRSNFILNESL